MRVRVALRHIAPRVRLLNDLVPLASRPVDGVLGIGQRFVPRGNGAGRIC
jgi:hypothetical protein